MENILELKTINELNEYFFYIPSYQRGYKWSNKEVIELLNDMAVFYDRIDGILYKYERDSTFIASFC